MSTDSLLCPVNSTASTSESRHCSDYGFKGNDQIAQQRGRHRKCLQNIAEITPAPVWAGRVSSIRQLFFQDYPTLTSTQPEVKCLRETTAHGALARHSIGLARAGQLLAQEFVTSASSSQGSFVVGQFCLHEWKFMLCAHLCAEHR